MRWLRAAPTAIGMPPPTIPFAPRLPAAKSAMCMHPPAPLAVAGLLAQELGHHQVQPHSLADALPVAPVGRRHPVLRLQGRADADAGCLFPDAEVRRAVDLAFREKARGGLLEAPGLRHPRVDEDGACPRGCRVRARRAGWRFRCTCADHAASSRSNICYNIRQCGLIRVARLTFAI